ncbi:MAG: hypothetical protein BMS9Abin37_0850 [Acidobacteriota bacterium]|nr:MAG: hypothetical protein BMS9Abin37_0850 [Acidobacteriota bacterium]
MASRMVIQAQALLFATLLTLFGCTHPELEQLPETDLARAEVIRIAEIAAEAEGYDIRKYNMTGCHYEFTQDDHTWTVFYELKPPTPPGGHFVVSIDDRTKKATLGHGE